MSTNETTQSEPAERGRALIRYPGPRLSDGLVTHVQRQQVDLALALDQHNAYVEALRTHGWKPTPVPPANDHPDAVFIEDTVVVVDDVAVLTRPGAPQRRGEINGTESVLAGLGYTLRRIEAPGTLDGGDVLQIGKDVYAGLGGRTTAEGVKQLREHLRPLGRVVHAIPLREVLHLKSAVTALPDGTPIGIADLVDAAAMPAITEPPEAEGAHVVPLGDDAVLLAASAPRTAQWLTDRGLRPVVVDISEFEKLEGCVTCLSVLLPSEHLNQSHL